MFIQLHLPTIMLTGRANAVPRIDCSTLCYSDTNTFTLACECVCVCACACACGCPCVRVCVCVCFVVMYNFITLPMCVI